MALREQRPQLVGGERSSAAGEPRARSTTPRAVTPGRGPSIAVRLVALVLLTLLPVGAVLVQLERSWRSAAERDAAAGVERLAEAAAVHQDNLVRSTALLLRALTLTPHVTDRTACARVMASIHDELPQYGVMGVSDAAGNFWCSSRPTPEPVTVTDRDYFIAVRDTLAPAVGDYQIGRVTGKPTVALAHPLLDPDGRFAGAVIASIDLSRPALLAERLNLPEGSTVTVYDGRGTVLMRWPVADGFVGREAPELPAMPSGGGTARLEGLDGVERIYGFATIGDAPGQLTLTVGVPVVEVHSAAGEQLRWSWLWLGGIAALAAAAALGAGHMLVVRPVRRLGRTARRVASGDLSARASGRGGGELADLAAEFDAMASALELREVELRVAEQRAVEERYRGLLDVAADAVVITDRGGRIQLFNRGAEQMLGLPSADAVGRPVGSLLRDIPQPGERKEVGWEDAEGRSRWADVTASLGEDELVTLIVRDVTAAHEAAVMEAALRESDTRFRLAQQHSSIGLALVALDGRWLNVNPALCRIVGRTPEEMLGLTFQDITHPDDLDADLAQVERLLSGEIDGYEIEKRYKHVDGSDVWIQLNGAVVRDDAGEPQYFVAQIQDITERKRSQSLLELVFDASPDLLAIADSDGYLVQVNPSWTERLGWSDEELLSGPLTEFVHPDDVAVTTAEYDALARGQRGTRRFDNRFRSADGSYRWLQWNAMSLPEMGLVVANARDVTAEREQQAELDRHRRELERSNAELEQFAYVASHDLSEPLRAISGFAALLKEELGEDLSDEAAEYLTFMMSGTGRMQALITDLLAFSRVSRQSVSPEPVDLRQVVAEVQASLAAALDEAGATLDIGSLPVVAANQSMMVQLFQNLVANALKFQRPEASAAVRVVVVGMQDGYVRIAVEDNGIGIEERYRERVFRMFQRLHTRSEYPGTGMGLAICAKIVGSYGGRIWIEDSSLGGTAFHLTLPLVDPPTDPPA